MGMATPAEQEAKRNWIGWMRHYMAIAKDGPISQNELAKRLRISSSALSQQFTNPDRLPSFEVLLACRRLTGWSLDQLLVTPPPRTH